MKKMMKRVLSVCLCLLMLGAAAPLGALADRIGGVTAYAAGKTITEYSVGDSIEFGWYPQTDVTAELGATLNALAPAWADWTSYGYYSGTGDWSDGKMTPKDYMRFCDVTYDGQKYRAVRFTQYRPSLTGSTSYAGYTEQDDNGYVTGTTYWFRYDPLQWRVLDPATGLVLCETIIDSQPYNNYILRSGTDAYGYEAYWGDAGKTHYANNYAESSLRQWLNRDFYNTAFSAAQQAVIVNTTLDNSAYSTSYSAYDSATTTDKIFLLSYSDARNTAYGFNNDTARLAKGSDYAKCQGVYVSSPNECSFWWLRSAGDYSLGACNVDIDGWVNLDYSCSVVLPDIGIRPAFKFNLSSEIFQSDNPGQPDDPGTGDEPNKLISEVTFDQDYYWTGEGFFGEHAAVTDSLEFYVELENSVPIAPLNPSQPHVPKTFAPITMTVTTNANTLTFDREGTQHSYSVTFDALEEHQMVNDLILLFPQKGFSAERKYTVTFTYSCADFDTITETYTTNVHALITDPIEQHLNFIAGDSAYHVSKLNLNGQYIGELRTDAEYQWSKYTSFDFKNYYNIVVADLLTEVLNTTQLSADIVPNYIKNWKKHFETIRKGLNTMVFDKYGDLYDVSELKIEKLMKCIKYTDKDIWTEDVLYKAITKMFGNKGNVDRFTRFFAAADKLNMWASMFQWGVDVLNETLDAINKLTLLESFHEADEALKDVVRNVYSFIPSGNTKMREALQDYLNYDESTSGMMTAYVKTFWEMHGNINLMSFKTVFGKKVINYAFAKVVTWAGNIELASGPLSSTAAFTTITSAASGFFTGVSLGLTFSEILCDSSSKAKEMAKAISMAEYAQYIVRAVSSAETNLQNKRSSEALNRFEYAFALHKAAQVYIAEHTIKALEYKRDSIAYKLFGNKKSADEAVEGQLNMKSMFSDMMCHSENMPVVFTDKTTRRKVIAVKCPVNVDVFDYDNGDIVAHIVDNEVVIAADEIECAIYESEKYILIPDTEKYFVRIQATDQGTMSYSVSEWEDGELKKEYGKANISLTEGQIFQGIIPEDRDENARGYNLKTDGNTIELYLLHDAERFYVLSYNGNGSGVSNVPENQIGKTTCTISSTVPTRWGYSFLGWAKSSDATKAEYVPGDLISLNEDTTLYAVWLDCALSFSGSAMIGLTDYIPITYGGQLFYYNFTTEYSGKYIIYSVGDSDTTVTLYNASGNKIASNDNGGDGNNFMLVQSLTAGETYYYAVRYKNATQTGRIMVKLGKVFTVDYNANGGSGVPTTQEKFFQIPLTLSSTIPNKSYTVFFNTNASNATVAPTSKSVNCTFGYWTTGQSGNGFKFNAGESYTFDSSRTLYAQWTDAKAGALPTPTRRGYTFDGWFTAASGGSMVTSSSTISADTVLYAHWTLIPVVGCDILSAPNKTTYYYKENTDLSGIALNIRYADGSTSIVTDTTKMTFDGLTTASVGTKTVNVECNGFSTSFDITVKYAWWQILIRIFLLGFLWY